MQHTPADTGVVVEETAAAVHKANKRGEWSLAVELATSALRLDSAAHAALFEPLARAFTEQLPSPQTLVWFDDFAADHAPARAFASLGWLYLWAGDRERGLRWLRRAWPAHQAAKIEQTESLFDVLALFREAIEDDKATAESVGQKHLTRIDLALGDVTSARRRLSSLTQDRADAEAQRLLAVLDNESGDAVAALPHLKAAAAAAPSDQRIAGELARTKAVLHLEVGQAPVSRDPFEKPLSVMLAPHRDALRSWWFFRKVVQTDRFDTVRPQVFDPRERGLGWVHPVYCSSAAYLTPRARAGTHNRFLLDQIPGEIIEAVRRKEGAVLIDHGNEGLFRDYKREPQIYVEFLEHLKAERLPANRFIITDGNLASPEGAAALAMQAGVPDAQVLADRYLWMDFAGIFRRMRRASGGIDDRLIEAARTVRSGVRRSKHFLSFNHAPRPHRGALLARLVETGLLDRGLVSFKGPSYWREKKKVEMADEAWVKMFSGQVAALVDLDDTEKALGRLLALCPLEVDVQLTGTGGKAKVLGYGANEAWPYLDSYISIVTETDFTGGQTNVVTEKPLKAIANLHPFIYLGEPGALAEMRARGYRTFSPLIDERYDEIAEPKARMAAALLEVERLLRMPIEQLHEVYCELWPVLLHNYHQLLDGEPAMVGAAMQRISNAVSTAD